jgi:hypothetical protein
MCTAAVPASASAGDALGTVESLLETQVLAHSHPVLHAALAEGWVLSTSEALQVARWTRQIPPNTGPRPRTWW